MCIFFILAQKMLLCVSLDVIFCYSFIPFLLCLLFVCVSVCVCAFGHNIIELCHISKPMCLCVCVCMCYMCYRCLVWLREMHGPEHVLLFYEQISLKKSQ